MSLTKQLFANYLQSHQVPALDKQNSQLAIQYCLQILDDKHQIQYKINALKIIVKSTNTQEMHQALTENKKLPFYLKKRILSKNNDHLNEYILETIKYWATQCQIVPYMSLLEELFSKDIDFPNTYTYIISEEEIIRKYIQILFDHDLDKQALIAIIQNQSQNTQEMLQIYQQTFNNRNQEIIKHIFEATSILLSQQLNLVKNIMNFYQAFDTQMIILKKSKYKQFSKFIDFIQKEFNIQPNKPLTANEHVIQTNQQTKIQNLSVNSGNNIIQHNNNNNNNNTISNSKKQLNMEESNPRYIQQVVNQTKQQAILIVDDGNFENPFIKWEEQFKKYFNEQFKAMQQKKIILPKQQYSGLPISIERFDDQSLQQFPTKQLKKIKRACLRRKQKIFDSHELQIGVISAHIIKEELFQNFVQLIFFVGNKQKQPIFNCTLVLQQPQGICIWTPEIEHNEYIDSKKQQKYVFLVAYEYLLYKPLTGIFQWVKDDNVFIAEIALPCVLAKFMLFKPINQSVFKMMWGRDKVFMNRSEIFKLNRKIVKNPLDMMGYWNELRLISKVEEFFEQKKDLKYGGMFSLQDIRKRMLIKIIIRGDMSCVIKVTGLSDAEILIQSLIFILQE